MDGWIEWTGFAVGMVIAGLGVLAIFTVPLLVVIAGAGAGFVWWFISGPAPRTPRVARRERGP